MRLEIASQLTIPRAIVLVEVVLTALGGGRMAVLEGPLLLKQQNRIMILFNLIMISFHSLLIMNDHYMILCESMS